jgi:hypothetical protein
MSSLPQSQAGAALDRLVAALVDWGATASQIVSHMELSERSGASTASRSVVEVFSGLMTETLAPVLAGREDELERAAALIEKVDRTVGEELFMVPIAPPRPRLRATRQPE